MLTRTSELKKTKKLLIICDTALSSYLLKKVNLPLSLHIGLSFSLSIVLCASIFLFSTSLHLFVLGKKNLALV